MSFSTKRTRRNKLRRAARELQNELTRQGLMKPEPEGPLLVRSQSKPVFNNFAKEAEKERRKIERQNRRALGQFFPRKQY